MDPSHELKPNIMNDDGILSSGIKNDWKPTSVGKSLAQHLISTIKASIEEKGDWLFMEDLMREHRLCASDVVKMSERCSAALRTLGMKKGDTVHIFVGNHIYSHILVFASWMVGGIASLGIGDGTLEAEVVADQLIQLNCNFIICLPETQQLISDAVCTMKQRLAASNERKIEAANDPMILVWGETKGAVNLESMVHAESSIDDPKYEVVDEHKDICAIFWSSGTTGQTKGICHTPHSVWNFGGFAMEVQLNESTYFSSLSLFHCSGYWMGVVALLRRNTIYTVHHDHGREEETCEMWKELADKIVRVRPKFLALHAHYFTHMLSTGALDQFNQCLFDSIEILRPAGSAVPKAIEEAYRLKCRNLKKIVNTYGSSETGIVSLSYDLQNQGGVLPLCSLKIRDFGTGGACGTNEYGEIVVKTPYMMKNYFSIYNQNDKGTYDDEGFFRTGDVGFYGKDGFLHYVDRSKDLIKYNGSVISPYEIEGILHHHPAVLESLVYGQFQDGGEGSQLICAKVVLVSGCKATASELMEFVNSKIPEQKWMRGTVTFQEKLPRNGMGKLVRGQKLWKKAIMAAVAF